MNKNTFIAIIIASFYLQCSPDITIINEQKPDVPLAGSTGIKDENHTGTAGAPIVIELLGGSSGSAGFFDSAGTSGESSKPDCIPLDCTNYAYQQTGTTTSQACGIIEDGCGKVIDCGLDCLGYEKTCGGPVLNVESDTAWSWKEKHTNICGGGCKFISQDDGWCDGAVRSPGYRLKYSCYKDTSGIPNETCKPFSYIEIDGVQYASTWCCIDDGEPYEE